MGLHANEKVKIERGHVMILRGKTNAGVISLK